MTNKPARPWTKLKREVEKLFDPTLGVELRCAVYTHPGKSAVKMPRHYITLDGEIIWDFPAPFVGSQHLQYYFDPYWTGADNNSWISDLLRAYVDRPRDQLLEPFEDDHWGLTDILRAADRRVGKRNLIKWALTADGEHPARAVLRKRFL